VTRVWLVAAALWCAAAPAAATQQQLPTTQADTLSVTPPKPPAAPPVRRRRRSPALRRPEARRTVIEGRRIARLSILPRNVYDPAPPSHLATFHRLANRLHIRTRKGTVRSHLLFGVGDRWSEQLGRETARNLRALDFLDPKRVVAEAESDSIAVTVETRDLWTTSPEINLESGGGRQSGSLGFTERNLLGLGKSISLSYHDDAIGVSRRVAYDDPNLFGSRHELHVQGGRSTDGASTRAEAGLPFYAEAAPFAYDLAWSRSTFVSHLYERGSETASIDERLEEGKLWFGARVPDGATIVRLTGSLELEDRRRGPTRLAPGASNAFAGGEENLRRRLVAAQLRLWRPRYVELEDINRMDRVEDFDLGTSATFKAGISPKRFGATADEGHLELGLDAGAENPAGFGYIRSNITGWLRPSPLDVIARVDARWFFLPPGHTVVLGALGISGTDVSRDFQVNVGGLNGLRAYPVQAVSGRKLWRLNAEDRWIFSPENWTLLKLGSAVFFDAARAWGPGGDRAGWFQDGGVGLRLGLPQLGLSQVVRIDVAWPISPTRDGRRQPVFSFGSNQAF
jgi:Omp85 superfamily domain